MSVNNIRDNIITASSSKAWKNLLINELKCKSLSVDDGIIADGISNTAGDILFDTTAPLNNQGLIYNSSTGKIEFKTLIDNTGILSLNSCVGLVQSFGTNSNTISNGFQIISNPLSNTHIFTISDAGPSSRGFITATNQQIQGQKTFLNDILCGTSTAPRVLYTNNIISHNSGSNTIDIAAPTVNINCSTTIISNKATIYTARPVVSSFPDSSANIIFGVRCTAQAEIISTTGGINTRHLSDGTYYLNYECEEIFSPVASISTIDAIGYFIYVESVGPTEINIYIRDSSGNPKDFPFNVSCFGYKK